MKHTKEPWRVGNQCCIVSDTPIPEVDSMSSVEYYGGHCICESVTDTNAERIVACVNACQGITTEALEKGVIASTLKSYEDLFISREMYRYKHIKDIENSISKGTMTCCGYKIWEEEDGK